MTQTSLPWPGVSIGDARAYSATEWSDVWEDVFRSGGLADGIMRTSGNGTESALDVQQQSTPNKSVRVFPGAGIVAGKYFESSATENLTISDNTSGNPRIDLIIMQSDYSAQTIRLAVLEGTPAGSPVPPTLTQTKGVLYEVSIAEVAVANGFSSITDANITPVTPKPVRIDVQIFLTNGTYNKPDYLERVRVMMLGGGGGGGGGCRGAEGTDRSGGGGGGGGSVLIANLDAVVLDDGGSVVVGAGGTGGSRALSDSTGGSAGNDGGDSFVDIFIIGKTLVARGGEGGGGGVIAGPAASGGSSWIDNVELLDENLTSYAFGADGGLSSVSHAQDRNLSTVRGPTGGGGGGGRDNTNTSISGGDGGDKSAATALADGLSTLVAGGTGGGSAQPGTSFTNIFMGGTGGGGGPAGDAGAAGNGADGGTYGGGGGGGGASQNGQTAGDGGDGADGIVVIIGFLRGG